MKRLVVAGVVCLAFAATSVEARTNVEITPFGALRTKSSLGEGYYSNDLADNFNIAAGGAFGLNIAVPLGYQGRMGQQGLIDLTISYQKSDLRFDPDNIATVPDSIRNRFDIEDDQLILGDVSVTYIHLGGKYRFGNFLGWQPDAGAGLGATVFTPDNDDVDSQTKFSFSLALGVNRSLGRVVGTRMQIRGYVTSLPSDEGYWVDYWGNVWTVTDSNVLFQAEFSLGLVFRL